MALQAALTDRGYTLYDPFAGISSPYFPHTIKLFVAPMRDGWVRVLIDAVPAEEYDLARTLSGAFTCLLVTLENRQSDVRVFVAGETVATAEWFAAQHPHTGHQSPTSQRIGDFSFEELPPDLRELSTKIDSRQASGMFRKFASQLLGDKQTAARALFDNRPDWHHPAHTDTRSLLDGILPARWYEPDFAALRAAWVVHASGTTLSGDQAMLTSIPDALQYQPIYAGKTATGR
jgi:hypothetical protein